jgi:hypothetical protein
MVNLHVGITDYDWFQFLSAQRSVDEVNFWQPGGRTNFKAIQPGELFLCKLHSPRKFEVGRRLKEDFENGRHYYAMERQHLLMLKNPGQRPSRDLLEWQQTNRFLG